MYVVTAVIGVQLRVGVVVLTAKPVSVVVPGETADGDAGTDPTFTVNVALACAPLGAVAVMVVVPTATAVTRTLLPVPEICPIF